MKTLFSQIFNEWRANLWLALELLVVSVVMWYIADYLYTTISVLNEPKGFDTEHCYRIHFNWLNEKSPDYKADKDSVLARASSMAEMMERLRLRPEIEAVSVSFNAYPYNGSNSSITLSHDSLQSYGYVIRRIVSPDFVKVFRYEGANGETPDELSALLRANPDNVLVSNNLFEGNKSHVNAASLVNQELICDGDSSHKVNLAAALKTVKYSDYGWARGAKTVVVPCPYEFGAYANELCVRVRDNMDADFIENLKADSESQLRVDNLYIADVMSFDYIREAFQRESDREVRNYIIGMLFLLLNIFLGLLGTFWFRTQQRVGEIAIRKVSGATRMQIFGRLMGEGILLLSVVTVLAVIVDINLAYMEFNTYYGGSYLYWPRVLTAAVVVYVLMALMVVAGIYFPARKAMSVEPAEVLRDE